MKLKKVNEIMSRVMKVWTERHGLRNINPKKIVVTREILLKSPYEDGLMRVALIGEKETHLVPFEEIILNGLKGEDIKKYPIET